MQKINFLGNFKKTFSALFLMVLFAGCATVEPYDPFNETTKAEVLEKIKTVAFMPVQISVELEDEKEKATAKIFEDQLIVAFKQAGFNVIPSDDYAAIWDPLVEQAGGFFDAVSGEFDEEKFKSIRDIAKKEFATNHSYDAFVAPRVLGVSANWSGNRSTWHGVTEATTGTEGFWAGMSVGDVSGSIPAYSLLARLIDDSDNIIYADFGGIQLAANYKAGMWKGGFTDVPEEELFIDQAKMQRAVDIATKALLGSSE